MGRDGDRRQKNGDRKIGNGKRWNEVRVRLKLACRGPFQLVPFFCPLFFLPSAFSGRGWGECRKGLVREAGVGAAGDGTVQPEDGFAGELAIEGDGEFDGEGEEFPVAGALSVELFYRSSVARCCSHSMSRSVALV